MTDQPTRELRLLGSRHFAGWLREQGLSLAFSTYQAGKLFLIGLQPETERLSIFERTFNRSMGLWASPQTLYLSTLYQIWRFENALENGQRHDGYDRVYVPRVAWTSGDLDVHDVACEEGGRVLFAATLFNCVGTISQTHSFVPVWRPAFVSALAPEDRCHLNGIALRDGRLRYATCVSRSDAIDGWREHRADGGIVIDTVSNEVVAAGLSMPHSPRWYAGRLWVHDSGTGHFGYVDLARGRFEKIAFCPGYLRGLAFHREFAVMGLSLPRGEHALTGLPLDENLRARKTEARCALQIVNLKSGNIAHWLRIDGVVRELYDVAVLPGVMRPMAIGFKSDEIQRIVSVGSEPAPAARADTLPQSAGPSADKPPQ
jgi:uncharacterized protein (TIGR03032 family)